MSGTEPIDEVPPALLEAFREEAAELLADMEAALMGLEERPGDAELVARAFRALHTIKGNAVMFGFEALEALAHELEHVFDLLRKGRMAVSGEIVSLTLGAKDRLHALLRPGADSEEEARLREGVRERIAALLAALPAAPAQRRTEEAAPVPAGAGAGAAGTLPRWRILFRPGPGTFASGTDPLAILEGVRGLGACLVTARFDEVPPLAAIDPDRCYLWWEMELATDRSLDEIRDAFIFVGGPESAVEIVPAGAGPADPARAAAAPAPPAGAKAAAAPPAQRAAPAPSAPPPAVSEGGGTLRVGAARLDALVDLVGELVTMQARLSRHAELSGDPSLGGIAEEVERLTADLRDLTLGIRMVPVRPAFGKFRRLVRDLAHEIGREVDFRTEGEETELDKTVIERLGDPIVHILRNCIDHGVEPPAERERAGKPRRGRVQLTAAHAGPTVVIRIEDDGRGIDLEAVRRKAVERGLLGEHEERGERELQALLFAPGFSTSARVTSVSGRGVGLDVVRRAVEALRGGIRVESRPGRGTSFELRLPLTLAIIEGLEVVVGGERFIVPLVAVRECVELPARAGGARRLAEVAEVRGELLPFLRLREWLGVRGAPPAREQIVITEAAGRRAGLLVDFVVGEHQTVIKPLGRVFRDVRGLAGSTILGDGTVALILDVEQLVLAVEGAGGDPAGC